MDADQMRRLRPELTRLLKRFDDCFARRDPRAYLSVDVQGQLAPLSAKSCEPIALAAGVPPLSLQEFLSAFKWDESLVRDRLRELVVADHTGPNSIAILEETSDVKQGDKTPGVQRQWCGTVGKTENCIVTVHLAHAQADVHRLLERRDPCDRCHHASACELRPATGIAISAHDAFNAASGRTRR